jgi:uncharacterized protein YqeY
VNLTEQLQADMKTAMRDGDAERRDTLRMVISAAQVAAKDKRAPLTDEEALEIVAGEVKKRRESIEAFQSADRPDLADKERAEIDILTPYLKNVRLQFGQRPHKVLPRGIDRNRAGRQPEPFRFTDR